MNKRMIAILCFIVLTLPGVSEAKKIVIPFNKFVPGSTIKLQCISHQHTVSIPIPDRWKVSKATIHFDYTNSRTLIGGVSQIGVSLNDVVVAQKKLDPENPDSSINAVIPGRLFENGYNNLVFSVAQHYTYECEHSCAPNLWTNINTGNGYIEIEYALKNVPLKLSDVSSFIFDPKIFPQGKINFVIPKEARPVKDELLTVATTLTSGISNRFDYREVAFTVSEDIVPGMDNILLGTDKGIKETLSKWELKRRNIKGPFINITHLPIKNPRHPYNSPRRIIRDRTHALLIVSGKNMDHLKIAAETTAVLNFPYPGTDRMTVRELNMGEVTEYSGKGMLTTGKTVKFKDLGFETQSFIGLQPTPGNIRFRLAPDFLIRQNNFALLKLNFAYGAGLRSESGLSLLVNGKFVMLVNMDDEKGKYIEGYEVKIPTHHFKPGNNTITLAPIMTPLAKKCDLIQPASLFLTVFENSTILFPNMPHLVEMPNIKLFMVNGFPFTRWPDGFESKVYIADKSNKTLEATLNIIGLMSQKNGYPLFSLQVTMDKPDTWGGDLLVIGKVDSIPEELLKNTILRLGTDSVMTYPIAKFLPKSLLSLNKHVGGLGKNNGVMLEFKSPYANGKTILMFTATTPADLHKLSLALLNPSVQQASSGDFVHVAFTKPNYDVNSLDTGDKYFVGKEKTITKVELFLYSNNNAAYMLAIVSILFFILSMYYIYKNIKNRGKHKSENTQIIGRGKGSKAGGRSASTPIKNKDAKRVTAQAERDGVERRRSFLWKLADKFKKLFLKGS